MRLAKTGAFPRANPTPRRCFLLTFPCHVQESSSYVRIGTFNYTSPFQWSLQHPLLVLAAIVLKLEDEEALWKLHDFETMSNCHMRYMLQHPSASKGEKGPVIETIRGHTDFGTFTLLFRQPIAGLQIRTADNSWKWVKAYPASITVNVAVCHPPTTPTPVVLRFTTDVLLSICAHRRIPSAR